ncbi:MAG: hypothetical protein QM608_18730 [Caulobacter sp.]
MTTTYTIRVLNHSAAAQSYTIFAQPPAAPGTGVYTQAWASLDNVASGGFDAINYTPENSESAPHFYVNDIAFAAGEPIDCSTVASAPIEVDFTDKTETTATVIQQPNRAFLVSYE